MAAVGDLGAQPGLQALGLTLAFDLPGDLALTASDGVNAGVDEHLIAAAARPDRHPCSLSRCRFLEKSLTASLTQSKQKQTAQVADLG